MSSESVYDQSFDLSILIDLVKESQVIARSAQVAVKTHIGTNINTEVFSAILAYAIQTKTAHAKLVLAHADAAKNLYMSETKASSDVSSKTIEANLAYAKWNISLVKSDEIKVESSHAFRLAVRNYGEYLSVSDGHSIPSMYTLK